MLLMDNINIYKGKRKHLRIFKQITSSMQNFTGRALIIRELSHETKALLDKVSCCLESQTDVLKLDPMGISYSPDEVFEQYKDYYILSAMDKVYNCLPQINKKMIEMSKTELNKWLTTADFLSPKRKRNQCTILNMLN